MHGRTSALLLLILAGCATAPTAMKPEEGFLPAADGTKIFYRTAGAGSDAVVVIHGGPGMDSQSIAPDLAPLERTHRMIYYDQRGGGRSGLPADTSTLTLEQHVADLEALRRFFGLEKITLLAHSFGPAVAAGYAIEHPERVTRMIFIGPIPPMLDRLWDRFGVTFSSRYTTEENEKLKELGEAYEKATDVQAACRAYWGLATLGRLADRASLSRIKADFCSAPPEAIRYGMSNTGPKTWASMGEWDWRPKLAGLRVPLLVIHGEREAIPMDMVEQWARSMPDAKLLRVPDAAHFPHVERPDIVFPAIEEFLQGKWPAGAR